MRPRTRLGVYFGTDARLKCRRAIVKPHPERADEVLALFAERSLPEAHEWSAFPKAAFELLAPLTFDEDTP